MERFGAIQLGETPLLHPPSMAWKLRKNPDDMRNRLDSHLEKHQLKMHEEEQCGTKQIIVVQRPAVDKVVYFARLDADAMEDLRAGGKLSIYAVPSEAMAAQMHARGYARVCVSHLGDDTHLPPKITSAASGGIGGGGSRKRSLAPHMTKLPASGFPAANNTEVESAAQQVLREWELHVEVDDHFYSPAYKWTMGARKAAGLTDYDMSVSFNIIDVSHTYPFDPS